MRIPKHLQGLRTDRRGLPVPYVNRWGPERVESLSLREDPHVRALAVFCDDADETEPDFTAQNMQRQRECMMRGLCQVCARAVPWSARNLVVAPLSVEQIWIGGRRALAVTEPWLCGTCAVFAVRVCPALIRRRREEQLQVVRVHLGDVTLIRSVGYVDGPLERESRRLKPTMWVKAIVTGLDHLVAVP